MVSARQNRTFDTFPILSAQLPSNRILPVFLCILCIACAITCGETLRQCLAILLNQITIKPASQNTQSLEDPNNPSRSSWSAGSAFSGIFLLQLSCVFQPSGSLILDGAINTWRFSPIYCLLDVLAAYLKVLYLLLGFGGNFSSVLHAIRAARYRSYRVIDYYYCLPAAERFPKTVIVNYVFQDIGDIRRQTRKRRILATMMGLLTVIQFAKLITVRGNPREVVVGYVLASIYFLYWLTNEAIEAVVGFTDPVISLLSASHIAFLSNDKQEPVLVMEMCLELREEWLFTVHAGGSCSSRGFITYYGGLCHFALGMTISLVVFGIGWSGLKVQGHSMPRELESLCSIWFFVLPWITVSVCLWGVGDFVEGFSGRSHMLNIWHTQQGIQAVSLILLFYLCAYDGDSTWRPGWTDWLGKV